MKYRVSVLGVVSLVLVFAMQLHAGDYRLDKTASEVKWNGRKVAGEHFGTIQLKSGYLQLDGSKISTATFEMDMTSIVNEDLTNPAVNKRLVDHLKSDDFFSVENHPVSRLAVHEVKPKAANVHTFTGDLTIKGITHPVSFDAEVTVVNGKLTAKGKMEVDRTQYDIRYGSGKFFQGLGDNLISDIFTLDFVVVANEAR